MEKYRGTAWQPPLHHYLQNTFLKRNTTTVTIIPMFSCDQSIHTHPQSMNKHQIWGFFWTTWALCPTINRKTLHPHKNVVSHFNLRPSFWAAEALIPTLLAAVKALPSCFTHTGQHCTTQKCIPVYTCAGCALLHPLPRHPNLEELETGLCSSLLIIPATNNRIAGKSGLIMGSHEPVIAQAGWKWDRYCLDTFAVLKKGQCCSLTELCLPCWWQSSCTPALLQGTAKETMPWKGGPG